MIILITGTSHTGKTLLAQKLLEKYKFPYLSIDHIKMGLIRSKNINFTVEDDEKLTSYLWEIIKEIIKTAIENKQDLIVEGLYIPFNWKKDFDKQYLENIKYYCLIMTRKYIENNFEKILKYANVIEKRLDDSYCTKDFLIRENEKNLRECKKYNCNYILIDKNYKKDIFQIFSQDKKYYLVDVEQNFIKLRKYKSSDCKEIIELFYNTVHNINKKDYTDIQLDVWAPKNIDIEKWNISLSENYTIIAENNGVIVGFGDINEDGYLDRLYVHKDFQKMGIATMICDELEKKINKKLIYTHASITAKRFFIKRGYKVIKEQFVERNKILLKNYIMEKREN